MSYDYNCKFWVATQNDLEDILKRQEALKTLKPIENKAVSHFIFAEFYVRYVQLVNKLAYVYHHCFQVQKREIVKGLVEAATQRLLELKNELKNLELSEFIYVDKVLVQRRLTPDDIVVWTPKYFPYWRPIKVEEMIYGTRKKMFIDTEERILNADGESRQGDKSFTISFSLKHKDEQSTNKTARRSDDFRTSKMYAKRYSKYQGKIDENVDPEKLKMIQAVILIQSHERARVARVLLTHILYNPKEYWPKMREDGLIRYRFTHKPNQLMLIPVRRTRFESNFYSKKRDITAFNYYVKPVYHEIDAFAEEEEEEEDMSSGAGSMRERYMTQLDELDNETEESATSDESGESDDDDIVSVMDYEEFMEKVRNLSAIKIQKTWRGYRDRKKYRSLVVKKQTIYGMIQEIKPRSVKVKLYKDRVNESIKHRLIKERYDAEFIQFCTDERARILRVRGPWIMEDISDNIRDWFKEFYDKLGRFHPYPDEVKGGTLLLLKGQTLDVFEYQDQLKRKKMTKEQKAQIKAKEKEKKMKLKAKLKKEKKALAIRRAKLKKLGIVDMKDELGRSKSIAKIETVISKYKKEWADIDEKLNKKQEPIKNWITSDYYSEIHQELQLTVDEMMRLEFELLQRALAKDLKKKYRAPKKKKPKNKKGKKKKVPIDMTADRSMESLFYELKDAGIIRTFSRKTFDSYIGDRNHCAFDLYNYHLQDPPPYQGEIKDILSEYVLGMGPLNITKPKSLLLVGPPGTGKTHLCEILATEIDAVMFDLSPEKTAQFDSNLKYFMHIIMKMAKIVQPTILFIHDVHRVFWKKIPHEFLELSPRLLQSQIKKYILKPIKKEDKIMLIGTTNAPWTAKAKMKKMFQKILLIPKTEYATNFILRRNFILQHAAIPRDIDITSLTLVTRNYNSGDIIANINETISLRRRMQLVKRPLHEMEFIDKFLDKDPSEFPMEPKMWNKFIKWYKKSSKMARKRAKMIKTLQATAERAKPKNKKK